jgi:bacterioferritin-associated ferredoxin
LIVCSCNEITTEKIRDAIQFVHEPNERLVLNMMNWQPDCAVCSKVLVEEIRRVMKEVMDGA